MFLRMDSPHACAGTATTRPERLPHLARAVCGSSPESLTNSVGVQSEHSTLRAPGSLGISRSSVVYRLLAFGTSSERCGNGPHGQDDEYPRLRRLDNDEFEQIERDGVRYLYDREGLLQSVKGTAS